MQKSLPITREEIANAYLHMGISQRNPEAVLDAIGKGADVNKKDEKGMTPLMVVATHGKYVIGVSAEAGKYDENVMLAMQNTINEAQRAKPSEHAKSVIKHLREIFARKNNENINLIDIASILIEHGNAIVSDEIIKAAETFGYPEMATAIKVFVLHKSIACGIRKG